MIVLSGMVWNGNKLKNRRRIRPDWDQDQIEGGHSDAVLV